MSYKAFFIFLTIFCTHLNAIIPEIEIWVDKENQRFRYLLKDIHVDYKGAKTTIKQQLDILWALQQNKDASFAIVEDSTSLFLQFMIEHQLKTAGTTNKAFPSSLQERINKRNWSKYKDENTLK